MDVGSILSRFCFPRPSKRDVGSTWVSGRKSLGVFQLEEAELSVEAGRISCQAAIRSDDPVAGDNQGDGIVPDRSADRL